MKKFILCFILCVAVTIPSLVLAAETYECSTTDTSFCALAPIPGLNLDSSGNPIQPSEQGIATFLNNLYFFSIGIAVILAIGVIIYGGVEYALSEAITSKAAGKKRITQALFGLVLVLAPALVFSIINPEILKLDVAFEPLKTTWGEYAQSSYTTPGVGGSEEPRLGQWCYQQSTGKWACNTSADGCQLAYDAATDPDRGDPSPPLSGCRQY